MSSAKQKADIQAAVEKLAEDFSPSPTDINFIFNTLTDYLNKNPFIFKATYAFSPEILNASPFVFRGENGLERKDMVNEIDYTTAVWYDVPVYQKKPVWSVPYFDFGGSGENFLLSAYSIPLIARQDSSFLGILTSDLLLAKIEDSAVSEPASFSSLMFSGDYLGCIFTPPEKANICIDHTNSQKDYVNLSSNFIFKIFLKK